MPRQSKGGVALRSSKSKAQTEAVTIRVPPALAARLRDVAQSSRVGDRPRVSDTATQALEAGLAILGVQCSAKDHLRVLRACVAGEMTIPSASAQWAIHAAHRMYADCQSRNGYAGGSGVRAMLGVAEVLLDEAVAGGFCLAEHPSPMGLVGLLGGAATPQTFRTELDAAATEYREQAAQVDGRVEFHARIAPYLYSMLLAEMPANRLQESASRALTRFWSSLHPVLALAARTELANTKAAIYPIVIDGSPAAILPEVACRSRATANDRSVDLFIGVPTPDTLTAICWLSGTAELVTDEPHATHAALRDIVVHGGVRCAGGVRYQRLPGDSVVKMVAGRFSMALDVEAIRAAADLFDEALADTEFGRRFSLWKTEFGSLF